MNTKKIIFHLLMMTGYLSIFTQPLSAWDPLGVTATARVAYFIPTSSVVRDVYSDGWADYQLEFGTNFCENWQLWTGVSGFSKKGHSTFSDSISGYSYGDCFNHQRNSTTLQLIPIYLGFKYFIPFTCELKAYVGAAASYSFLRIKDHSEYVHEHIYKNAFGGLIQTGLNYYFNNCFYINAFVDYYFQEFHFSSNSSSYNNSRYVERSNLNMGGFKIGAGLGISF